ncbi:hypothetical protein CSB45_09045 [candidate division KSB3 bacterium]|uniref:Uncharacterized protein n=1 Tax=candidate division KSB3 bacterium TaxID=2044937 RepID=A0A2G6E5A8_9BACT|nr:MAG: hypothetical protein CSB45_09045 [candidate division KSB3 bacterium]PIE29641.1 MAG: hypothetical protein CSA57_07385 [candidate division KSB3 bacterium]
MRVILLKNAADISRQHPERAVSSLILIQPASRAGFSSALLCNSPNFSGCPLLAGSLAQIA